MTGTEQAEALYILRTKRKKNQMNFIKSIVKWFKLKFEKAVLGYLAKQGIQGKIIKDKTK